MALSPHDFGAESLKRMTSEDIRCRRIEECAPRRKGEDNKPDVDQTIRRDANLRRPREAAPSTTAASTHQVVLYRSPVQRR